jgi:uncharacterized protein (TIGR02246 family)
MKGLTGMAAFVLMALPGTRAFAADSDMLREAQDRAQIETLMWKYVRALDTENAEAYAAVYTPDGQFGTGATATKGREALKKMVSDLRQRTAENEAKTKEKRPAMYHVVTNSSIEFVDKDHARFNAYWMTVFAAGGANVPARVAAAGREVDELVRLNGQWLIKVRDVAPKD